MGRKGRAAHDMTEGARRGPYGRFYGPWREEWAAARLSGTQYAVMLALCQWLRFTGDGRAYASRARREVASEAGASESAVKQAVQRLRRLGFVDVKQTGHRGRPTVYWVMPHHPWPIKGNGTDTPNKGSRRDTPNARKGYPEASQRGVSVDTPSTKPKGGLSAFLGSTAEEPRPVAAEGGEGGA